jgi:arabinogalactan oligomer/maltooligosaccharide transport system substrate-binding protein
MFRKRLLPLTLTAAVALASVASFSMSARAAGPTIQIWHGWQGAYADAITKVFDDFNNNVGSVNPDGIQVVLTNPSDLNNALQVAIPAGQGPDIIAWSDDQIGNNVLAGNIAPLDNYGVTQDFLTSTYEPAAITGVVYNGHIWALPEAQEGVALICNTALVKPSDFPTDPNDFAGLLKLATDFHTKNPDKYLIYNQAFDTANANGDAYHASPVFYGFGAFYVKEDGTVGLDTPEAIKAGQWIADFSKVAPNQASQAQGLAALTGGTGACMWTGPWELADIHKSGISYFIQPMGRPFVGIKVEMMTTNAVDRGNADAVVKVLKYFDSATIQAGLSAANGTIPAASAALKDPAVAKSTDVIGFSAALKLGEPQPNFPYMNALWGPAGAAEITIFAGKQSPTDALTAAAKQARDAIKTMTLPTPPPKGTAAATLAATAAPTLAATKSS